MGPNERRRAALKFGRGPASEQSPDPKLHTGAQARKRRRTRSGDDLEEDQPGAIAGSDASHGKGDPTKRRRRGGADTLNEA
jgi:hypothetical protein